tara:strand:+ start:831 stop:1073 length:243 start_codon:yes stop_codon:yes gene_type:complete
MRDAGDLSFYKSRKKGDKHKPYPLWLDRDEVNQKWLIYDQKFVDAIKKTFQLLPTMGGRKIARILREDGITNVAGTRGIT